MKGGLAMSTSTPLPDSCSALLTSWIAADFRGVGTLERRPDRRALVGDIVSRFGEQALDPAAQVLLIAADEVSCDQWKRYLLSQMNQPAETQRWQVRTADEILAEREPLADSVRVVIADELETYVGDSFGSLLETAGARIPRVVRFPPGSGRSRLEVPTRCRRDPATGRAAGGRSA